MTGLKVFFQTLAGLGTVGVALTCVITVVDVLGRWLFHRPIYGADELQQQILIPSVAACFALVLYERSSIAIEFGGEWIESRFGAAWRRVVVFAADLSTAAFFSVAAYQMVLLMLNSRRAGEVTAAMKFPLWVAYGCSSAFLLVAALTATVVVFRTSHPIAGVDK